MKKHLGRSTGQIQGIEWKVFYAFDIDEDKNVTVNILEMEFKNGPVNSDIHVSAISK